MPPETTPMMQQYLRMKELHPDCILFFRLGDFYEMFFDDAVTAAGILEITEATSKSQYSRARKKLRELLESNQLGIAEK